MYVLMLLSVVLVALCALGMAYLIEWADTCTEKQADEHGYSEQETSDRERQKQAFYMSNFWNYDGSEQQEWDDDSGV